MNVEDALYWIGDAAKDCASELHREKLFEAKKAVEGLKKREENLVRAHKGLDSNCNALRRAAKKVLSFRSMEYFAEHVDAMEELERAFQDFAPKGDDE